MRKLFLVLLLSLNSLGTNKPNIVLILGDRFEAHAAATTALLLNIPIAHIHGGDKSGGLDEYTRHAITKISNIHFTATKISSERIRKNRN